MEIGRYSSAGVADPPVRSTEASDLFSEQGYIPPIRVLLPEECQDFLYAANEASNAPALDWVKGNAPSSRPFYELATNPRITEVVTKLLGENVVLWGASIQTRGPGAVHPWHSDIESSPTPPCKTLSVWIGLEHTTVDSSLQLIPYSHRLGVTIQEVRGRFGRGREDAGTEETIRWAQELDRRSELVRVEMTDGEALFFDGKLWHGSHNLLSQTRHAVLLQYATADTVVQIPDFNYLEWPFQQLNLPKPPCIMISGKARPGINRIVSGPLADGMRAGFQLTSRIYPLRLPLAADEEKGWKPYPIFRGSTADLRLLSCHVSALMQGRCPHPPHTHDEEELLLLLAGEVDLILPTAPSSNEEGRTRLKSGQFVYYPAHFPHTIETVSAEPANYLMFKWWAGKTQTESPLGFGQYNIIDYFDLEENQNGFHTRRVLTSPTAYLHKFHCHTSSLAPGAGYEPHVDAYDVAIIVLEAEIETLGERVGPHAVIFYPAGEPHGIHNPGESVAKYIVFEFHGSRKKVADSAHSQISLIAKLRDPQRVKRKLKSLLNRFRDRVTLKR